MEDSKKKKYKLLHRVIVRYLFIAILFAMVTHYDLVLNTMAAFSTWGKSEGNRFEAGIVGFKLKNVLVNKSLLKQGSSLAKSKPLFHRKIEIKRGEDSNGKKSLPFWYTVNVNNISGDLCDKLIFKAKLNGSLVNEEEKDWKNFSYAVLDPANPDIWNFKADLKDKADVPKDAECDFDLVFNAWQKNPDYVPEGFSDTKTISNSIRVDTPKEKLKDEVAEPEKNPAETEIITGELKEEEVIDEETKTDAAPVDEVVPDESLPIPEFPQS